MPFSHQALLPLEPGSCPSLSPWKMGIVSGGCMLARPQRPSQPQWPHCPAPLLWAAECCPRQVASHFPGPTKASPAPHSVFCIPLVWSSPGTTPYPVVFPTFSSTWQLHNDGPGAHCCSFWLHTSMPCSGDRSTGSRDVPHLLVSQGPSFLLLPWHASYFPFRTTAQIASHHGL